MSKLNELITSKCPNGVQFMKLREIVEFKNGKGHEKTIEENGKYIVVNSKFISTNGKVIKKSNEQLTPVYIDDILIVMSDLPNGKALAKTFIVEEDGKYTLNQRIGCLTLKRKDLFLPKFLYYTISRNKQLLRYDNGTDQTNLRKDDILNIEVAVPPLEVQCEIVHILDDFTLLSAELSAELKERERQYEYYRNKLLTFSECTNEYKSEKVEWLKLEKILTIKNGKDYKHLENGKIPVYGSGGIMNYVNQCAYDKPSVLIPRKGSINKVYYVDKPFWNVDTVFYTIINTEIVLPKYLYYCLQNAHLEKLNTAGGIPSLTQKVLNKVTLPIPKIEIQKKIIDLLDEFDKLINDISEGLPAEIEARQQQYEYYRNKILDFKRLKVA